MKPLATLGAPVDSVAIGDRIFLMAPIVPMSHFGFHDSTPVLVSPISIW